MRIGLALLLAIVTCVLGAGPATQTVRTGDTQEDRRVKLVSVRISERRGQNLEAQFALASDPEGKVVEVVSFPAHSHTTHETTLMNIIRASVDGSGTNPHEWRAAGMVPIFSIPKERKRLDEFERWWFANFEERRAAK